MSKKCRAFSESKLGLEPANNRKAFYAGWDAAQLHFVKSTSLYTAPPKKEWVGLTDEEISIIWRDIDGSEGMLMRFAQAIEAKLREKNT